MSKTQFTLTDRLVIRQTSPFRTVEAEHDLIRISPKPLHVRDVPVRWILAALFFSGLAAVAAADGWIGRDMGSTFGFLLVLGCAVACSFNSWQLYQNLLIFRDRLTNQALFAIMRSRPTREAVNLFVDRLSALADRPNLPLGASANERSAFHRQLLDQLLEAEVLLLEEHSTITQRLGSSAFKAKVVKIVQ
ncbi:MAG: hypothetical protein EOP38_20670 [Rubrivivax sp.]|nr:MAG: hypothetical protein EOP38_20670 [Rubrivivax sp.]